MKDDRAPARFSLHNDIKNVEYVDEYNGALKEFRAFLGDPDATLRRVRPEPGK